MTEEATGSRTATQTVVRPAAPEAVTAAPAAPAGRHRLLRPAVVVGVCTAVALVLRLLVFRGLWVDEATSVLQVRLPFAQMLADLTAGDVHPPLHHAVLWATVRVIGDSELAVRLPSILAGTLLVPLLYLAGRDLYSRRTGLVAAALGTAAPVLVWYSQEARMYAFYALFALAAVWWQYRVLRGGTVRDWAGYTLATAALLWTHYLAALVVVAQQVAFLAVVIRRLRERRSGGLWLAAGWILAGTVVGLLLLPLEPIVTGQLEALVERQADTAGLPPQAGAQAGAEAGEDPISVYRAGVNVAWALIGYHSDEVMTRVLALWPIAMLLGLFLLGRGPWRDATKLLVWIAGFCGLGILAVALWRTEFFFELRYVIGVVPLLLLLLARLATAATRRAAVTVVVTVLAVGVMGVGLVDQQLNKENPRLFDFRAALTSVSEDARPGDVLVYAPQYLSGVVAYYAPDLHARSLWAGVPDPRAHRRVLVVVSPIFLDEEGRLGHAIGLLEELGQRGELVRHTRRANVETWVYR